MSSIFRGKLSILSIRYPFPWLLDDWHGSKLTSKWIPPSLKNPHFLAPENPPKKVPGYNARSESAPPEVDTPKVPGRQPCLTAQLGLGSMAVPVSTGWEPSIWSCQMTWQRSRKGWDVTGAAFGGGWAWKKPFENMRTSNCIISPGMKIKNIWNHHRGVIILPTVENAMVFCVFFRRNPSKSTRTTKFACLIPPKWINWCGDVHVDVSWCGGLFGTDWTDWWTEANGWWTDLSEKRSRKVVILIFRLGFLLTYRIRSCG